MCKVFGLMAEPEVLREAFGIESLPGWRPDARLTPAHACPVIIFEDGQRVLKTMSWGFVPGHARGVGLRPVNARSETAADKPIFEIAMVLRRCLIPTTGFYESRSAGPGRKQPVVIGRKDGKPFAMGGIWDCWEGGDEPLLSFALLTTEPNDVVAPIHPRMPVVVSADAYDAWLDPATPMAVIQRLMLPCPAEGMEAVEAGPVEFRRPLMTRLTGIQDEG